jgi:hypothetical protein
MAKSFQSGFHSFLAISTVLPGLQLHSGKWRGLPLKKKLMEGNSFGFEGSATTDKKMADILACLLDSSLVEQAGLSKINLLPLFLAG